MALATPEIDVSKNHVLASDSRSPRRHDAHASVLGKTGALFSVGHHDGFADAHHAHGDSRAFAGGG